MGRCRSTQHLCGEHLDLISHPRATVGQVTRALHPPESQGARHVPERALFRQPSSSLSGRGHGHLVGTQQVPRHVDRRPGGGRGPGGGGGLLGRAGHAEWRARSGLHSFFTVSEPRAVQKARNSKTSRFTSEPSRAARDRAQSPIAFDRDFLKWMVRDVSSVCHPTNTAWVPEVLCGFTHAWQCKQPLFLSAQGAGKLPRRLDCGLADCRPASLRSSWNPGPRREG